MSLKPDTTYFFNLPDEDRKSFYQKEYHQLNKSWKEIADSLKTYTNKVRRDARRLGIESRDHSEAQKLAIQEGRHSHPTEGTVRSEETKRKISEKQAEVWSNLSDEERRKRSKIGKEAWDKKTEAEKIEFFKKSAKAVQEASRTGSKIEKYVYNHLIENGFSAKRHVERHLKNEKFHIDIYVPECQTAIEIDGPMHYEPLYGEEKLMKRQAADSVKTGLILSSNLALLRVKLEKRESQKYFRDIAEKVVEELQAIKQNFPSTQEERYRVI
jgi:very-short-patch-repair endonuclease